MSGNYETWNWHQHSRLDKKIERSTTIHNQPLSSETRECFDLSLIFTTFLLWACVSRTPVQQEGNCHASPAGTANFVGRSRQGQWDCYQLQNTWLWELFDKSNLSNITKKTTWLITLVTFESVKFDWPTAICFDVSNLIAVGQTAWSLCGNTHTDRHTHPNQII